jgi:hypothetical protein
MYERKREYVDATQPSRLVFCSSGSVVGKVCCSLARNKRQWVPNGPFTAGSRSQMRTLVTQRRRLPNHQTRWCCRNGKLSGGTHLEPAIEGLGLASAAVNAFAGRTRRAWWIDVVSRRNLPGTRPYLQSMHMLVAFCPTPLGWGRARTLVQKKQSGMCKPVCWPCHVTAGRHGADLGVQLQSGLAGDDKAPAVGYGVRHGAHCLSRTCAMFDSNGLPRFDQISTIMDVV